ncbi:MAG: corrinoid protein [Desulfobacterales bacterium]|jgi:5-methyltetrahydrofolate--homocysteine methyltransferase
MTSLSDIQSALIGCDAQKTAEAIENALEGGVSAQEILSDGLIAAMDVVGEKMESGEMFIPEVLMAASIMSVGVERLKPMLAEGSRKATGKVVFGTVKGDLHDIGKNLVVMMLEGAGFEVQDMGVDIASEAFVEAVKSQQPDILALSALLTTTMPRITETIAAIQEAGLRDRLKIMIGGAPVSQTFANEAGADGFAPDAGSAVRLAKTLIAA